MRNTDLSRGTRGLDIGLRFQGYGSTISRTQYKKRLSGQVVRLFVEVSTFIQISYISAKFEAAV